MSECTDKRFEDMLHAFELGMLDDTDYEQFRLHLMACSHCFERAQKMEAAAALLRNDPDIRAVAGEVVDESKSVKPARSRFWPTVIPTSVVAAAILVLLILKPWQLEIRPTDEAIAAENRLAIINFDNLAETNDPQRLGEITASLLIADLSESHYLRVVSSQRLYDLLKLMGEDNQTMSDPATAARVAEEAGARWMLTGGILQTQPQIIVTSQLTDLASGEILASQRVGGNDGEDIFSLVDRLTIQIKNDLSLPMAALQEPDGKVADKTTHSPLAYRYYLEGLANVNRYYTSEAAESFRKALREDSTFAMVYYYLSLTDDQSMIHRAVQYVDRATRNERFLIRSREAYLTGDIDRAIRELQESLELYPDNKEANYRMGICYAMKLDFEKSIHYYKKAAEIDPLYKTVYNQMAYTYDWMGYLDSAIQAIDMYISIAPGEANPYDSRGDIYTRNGRLRQGIESYSQALDIRPDFWPSLYKFGRNHLFLGDLETADSCFAELSTCDNPLWRSNGWAARAYVPLYRGQFDKAAEILSDGLEAIESDPEGRPIPLINKLKAIVYEEQGRPDLMVSELGESIRINRLQSPDNKTYNRHLLARALALNGDTDSARIVADEMLRNCVTANDTARHWFAVAAIDYAEGNLPDAIAAFDEATEDTVIPYTPAICLLAQIYLEVGRWSDAIAELQRLQTDFTETRLHYGNWVAKSHYWLGLAHENLGQTDLAKDEYRMFLESWQEADPGLPELADARERLARLKTGS